ncbi:MAG: hypothetical protein LC130_37245 [Bryobacterales bacterium]|nr:hypothetical protein [Bryobacterales bacterium]
MTFTFTIPQNDANQITFDYDEEAREQLDSQIEDSKPVVFMNREGMVTMAKLLLKMAHGSYSDGFHVHLHQNFDADEPEVLTIVLLDDKQ